MTRELKQFLINRITSIPYILSGHKRIKLEPTIRKIIEIIQIFAHFQ